MSGTGRFQFRDILADPQAIGLIFQDFVRNFFRIKRQLKQHGFTVKGEWIRWMVDDSVGSGPSPSSGYAYRHLPFG